ncbi:MAG: ATP-binding protein [Myxococcales bacterium]|nr:ATP-binding protein [Myxococcales bacterium]
MLLQFAVENYLSVREQAVLSMLKPPGARVDPRHVVRVGDTWEVLRCAALYGANASGKSNLVRALGTFRRLVTHGVRPDETLPAQPFLLDGAHESAPTRFELELLLDGQHHAYGIVFTRERVVQEWLYRVHGAREEMLFERKLDPAGEAAVITLGETVTADPTRRQFLSFVATGTRDNQPFLTECGERKAHELTPVLAWCRETPTIIRPEAQHLALTGFLADASNRSWVEAKLHGWGTGVAGIEIQKRPVDGPIPLVNDEPHGLQRDEAGLWQRSVRFRHGPEGSPTLPWSDESDGTRRLMHLLPALRRATEHGKGPSLLVIDELDRSLHTALTRQFVETFLDGCAADGSQTQLIFTTHDTNLLNGKLLPPASIWFVEKDRHGASQLYALAEFPDAQVDQLLEHLEDGYLQGRFGAIPFIASRDQLAWRPPRGAA